MKPYPIQDNESSILSRTFSTKVRMTKKINSEFSRSNLVNKSQGASVCLRLPVLWYGGEKNLSSDRVGQRIGESAIIFYYMIDYKTVTSTRQEGFVGIKRLSTPGHSRLTCN